MSVNYNLTVLTNRLQQVVNAIDAGPSNGLMQLLDSSNNALSTIQLSRPCGVVTNGMLTFSGTLLDPAAARSGYATGALFETSDGTVVISGLTVGTASPGASYDIFLTPSNLITAGQTVAIAPATITGH